MKEYISVKIKLRKLASSFGLAIDPDMLTINFIKKQDYALLGFISYNPNLNKFGITMADRLKNIHSFLSSKEYRTGIEGASMIDVRYRILAAKRILDRKTRERLLSILGSLKARNGIAVVFSSSLNVKTAKFYDILYHEWIHVLLEYNHIRLKGSKNEALCIYLQYCQGSMQGRDLKFLNDVINEANGKPRCQWNIFDTAVVHSERFVRLFKDKDTPKKRKDAMLHLAKG